MRLRIIAASAFVLLSTTTTVFAQEKVRLCVNMRTGEFRLNPERGVPRISG